jgi:hypothetical protein
MNRQFDLQPCVEGLPTRASTRAPLALPQSEPLRTPPQRPLPLAALPLCLCSAHAWQTGRSPRAALAQTSPPVPFRRLTTTAGSRPWPSRCSARSTAAFWYAAHPPTKDTRAPLHFADPTRRPHPFPLLGSI